jgi:hypothetical protein
VPTVQPLQLLSHCQVFWLQTCAAVVHLVPLPVHVPQLFVGEMVWPQATVLGSGHVGAIAVLEHEDDVVPALLHTSVVHALLSLHWMLLEHLTQPTPVTQVFVVSAQLVPVPAHVPQLFVGVIC